MTLPILAMYSLHGKKVLFILAGLLVMFLIFAAAVVGIIFVVARVAEKKNAQTLPPNQGQGR
jgi:hypothetical protein